MTQIFFSGHNNFGNRGCEALIRSISALVRARIPTASFITPSFDIALDSAQWPDATKQGIAFVESGEFPDLLRWWNRARRVVPFIEHLGRPLHRLPPLLLDHLQKSDLLVMTGGDNLSLDYDLPSLYDIAAYVDNAKKLGVPSMLWAASVGPFSAKPHVEKMMVRHLGDYAAVTVRESSTASYLRGLGLENIIEVTDPAFTLMPEPFDTAEVLPMAPEGIVGVNISPLVRGYLPSESARLRLDADVAAFVLELCEKRGYGVVLQVHVGPLDGGARNSDYHYMRKLVDDHGLSHPRLRLAPSTLNATQLKFLVSQFRYFVGARTHATIGAFSSCVPTISIAYSVKAKGINQDLFGDTRLVLDTPAVTLESLRERFALLERQEVDIRQLLIERIPVWKARAAIPVESVMRIRGQTDMSQAGVSVIIKALNEEANIARAIESALTAVETIGGEVILADSRSTDKTVEIALRYPVRIVRLVDSNERSCVLLQLGFQEAREFVYVLDGDMRLALLIFWPRHYATLLRTQRSLV